MNGSFPCVTAWYYLFIYRFVLLDPLFNGIITFIIPFRVLLLVEQLNHWDIFQINLLRQPG